MRAHAWAVAVAAVLACFCASRAECAGPSVTATSSATASATTTATPSATSTVTHTPVATGVARIFRETDLLREIGFDLRWEPVGAECGVNVTPNPFSPDGDGRGDRTAFVFPNGEAVPWDARDARGRLVPEGCYVAEVELASLVSGARCRSPKMAVCVRMRPDFLEALLHAYPNPAGDFVRLRFPCDPPYTTSARLPVVRIYTIAGERVLERAIAAPDCKVAYLEPYWYGEIAVVGLPPGIYGWSVDYGPAGTPMAATFAVMRRR